MNAPSFEGEDDVVLPFAVEPLDVRGRIVRLGASIDTILARHGYPDAVARGLGEAAALTVLLGSSLKFEGRFQLQTKSDGAIEMIVVDLDAPDRLRATARFNAERLARLAASNLKTADLSGTGFLAMTIDQGSERSRYQGVVALEGQGPRGRRPPVFPPVGADPDAGSPRRRRAVRGRPAGLSRRRPSRAVSADLARAHAPGGFRLRATFPRVIPPTTCRRRPRTMPGSRRNPSSRPSRITN